MKGTHLFEGDHEDFMNQRCSTTSRPDEVKKWQAERAKYPEAKKRERKK
jgi:hypothetical protein